MWLSSWRLLSHILGDLGGIWMWLPCVIMGCMVWKLLHRLSCHRESRCLLGQGGCLRALLPVCLLSQHSQSAMHSILHKKIGFPEAIIKLSTQTSPPAPCDNTVNKRQAQKHVWRGWGGWCWCVQPPPPQDPPNTDVRFETDKVYSQRPSQTPQDSLDHCPK